MDEVEQARLLLAVSRRLNDLTEAEALAVTQVVGIGAATYEDTGRGVVSQRLKNSSGAQLLRLAGGVGPPVAAAQGEDQVFPNSAAAGGV